MLSRTRTRTVVRPKGIWPTVARLTKRTSRTNWAKLESQDDSDIDYSDIPPLGDTFFAQAKLVIPNGVQLDTDVFRWFRQHNPDYTEQINNILRQYIETHEQAA